MGAYDADFLTDFCTLVELCRTGGVCTPFTIFTAEVVDTSPAGNTQTIIITFTNPSPDFLSVTLIVRRVINGVVQVNTVPAYTASLLPGNSPATTPAIPTGQYEIELRPNFASGINCPSVKLLTDNCPPITMFQAYPGGESGYEHFNIKFETDAAYGRLIIGLPNGGTWTQDILNNGATTNIPLTTFGSQFGNYTFTMYSLCNATTNYIGDPSAPIVIYVTPPNNSTFTNNSGGAMTSVQLTAYAASITQIFNATSVAGGGGVTGFYIASGFYNSIVLTIATGTIAAGNLVTGAGTIAGVVSGSQITFSNVTITSGCTIALT